MLDKNYIKMTRNRGFTLIETLVVIGVFTILGSGLAFINFNIIKKESIYTEAEIIKTNLQRARSKAQNNINQNKHGLVIMPDDFDGYVLFEGENYNPSDTKNVYIKSSYKIDISSSSKREIIFEQLSGNIINSGNIEMIDPETKNIVVIKTNYEGKISW